MDSSIQDDVSMIRSSKILYMSATHSTSVMPIFDDNVYIGQSSEFHFDFVERS